MADDAATDWLTQQDPIGIAGGANVYGFAGGDPVNYSDPYGLTPWWKKALLALGSLYLLGHDVVSVSEPVPGGPPGQVQPVTPQTPVVPLPPPEDIPPLPKTRVPKPSSRSSAGVATQIGGRILGAAIAVFLFLADSKELGPCNPIECKPRPPEVPPAPAPSPPATPNPPSGETPPAVLSPCDEQ